MHSVHTEVKHAENVAHDDANGVAAITSRYVAELEAAGHKIARHHVLDPDGRVAAHHWTH